LSGKRQATFYQSPSLPDVRSTRQPFLDFAGRNAGILLSEQPDVVEFIGRSGYTTIEHSGMTRIVTASVLVKGVCACSIA